MTPLSLINLALKNGGILGVGQTAMAEDVNDVFEMLNVMLKSWNRNRWLLNNLIDVNIPSTGAVSYTIGTGGDFNCAGADKIHAAFARRVQSPNAVDYPLTIIDSYEQYATISLKTLKTFPDSVFLDSSYPLGKVYFYPIPSNLYELHLIINSQIIPFTDLTTPINLPGEYLEALMWNLTARVRIMYQLPQDPGIVTLARASLHTIKVANTQIQTLKMPFGPSRGREYTGGVHNSVTTLDTNTLG